MNEVLNTVDRLVIEDRPWILGGSVWLMTLAAIYAVLTGQTDGIAETLLVTALGFGGAALAWWFFPFQTIVFDRPSGKVTRTIRRVGKTTTETLSLDQVSRAASQGQFSESGTRMERVALLTDGDPYPLELGFVGASRTPLIDAINRWLDN